MIHYKNVAPLGYNVLRISSKTGGKLVCHRACMLNPLVVRRFAPHGQWMYEQHIVGGREASGNNALANQPQGIPQPR